MHSFMQHQRARDDPRGKEAELQERRWDTMQHQFQQLQQQVGWQDYTEVGAEEEWTRRSSRCSLPPSVSPKQQPVIFKEPKLLKLDDGDEIEHFLITFEHIAKAYRWPKADWAIRLIPLLTGKARSACVAMDYNDTLDYNNVKMAILAKYEINTEAYRQQFRATDIRQGEIPKEVYVRVAICLPPGVMKREAVVRVHDNVLFLARYRPRLFFLAFSPSSVPAAPFKSQAHCETKPRQLEQSFYQTIAANYLIFRSSDDLPGAARPLSPAADVQTTPPPPHTPTARLRPESHPADDPPLPPPPLGERGSPPPPSAPPAYESP